MEKKQNSTRDKIIQSAFSFYDMLFFERISLSKIAAKAGITKPAIYKHFKSREDLENAMKSLILSDIADTIKSCGKDKNEESILEKVIVLLCKKKSYFYFILSNSLEFSIDNFLMEIEKHDIADLNLETIFDSCGNVADIEVYKKILFVSATMIFFQGARDFILLNKKLPDSDENIQEYAEKLSKFIISGGLGHDIKDTDALRLSQLDLLCSKEIQSLKEPCKFFIAIGNVVRRVGFSKTTIEELAKELGLAKSSLYTNFSSKKEMFEALIKEECLNLFHVIKKNLLYAKNSAECVYIFMETEIEFFLKRKGLLYVCRWLTFQNSKDDFKIKAMHEKREKTIGKDEQLDFTSFILNADIITQIPDFGTPKMDAQIMFSWIFHMPIFFLLHNDLHDFPEESVHAAMKDFFYCMEKGINFIDNNENNISGGKK
ncbi:TetR/AcrR family transcriptional regulator [uncultured Treponema sp.]|uniref:TetR/AcrR family transcriptional regulator n=2 Tax=uncultured Treponema sp. TaxID=162155 RepID=UPI0025E41A0F|nr:TetR/AcrR family transcriptional regulator [uncultured Treponema sp.]